MATVQWCEHCGCNINRSCACPMDCQHHGKAKLLIKVGVYLKQTDPEMAAELKLEGLTSNRKLGEYVIECDPEMFEQIAARFIEEAE